MKLLKHAFLAGFLSAISFSSALADTVIFFADSETRRPHSANGQPLEDGQVVQVGTFNDNFEPYIETHTLVDLLSNWMVLGQTFIESDPALPAFSPPGSFLGQVEITNRFKLQPAYLFIFRKSSSKPVGVLADNVTEFGLFSSIGFGGSPWIFPAGDTGLPWLMNPDEVDFVPRHLGSLDGDKLVLRTYDPAPAQRKIFGDFARYEGDWLFSVRFGFLWESATYPWIYHLDLGWLYHFGLDGGNLWVWSPDRGFLWISLHPYIYSAETGQFFEAQNP